MTMPLAGRVALRVLGWALIGLGILLALSAPMARWSMDRDVSRSIWPMLVTSLVMAVLGTLLLILERRRR